MSKNTFGTEQLTIQDEHGLRIRREVKIGDVLIRKIIVQTPSDDYMTALGKTGPPILEMPKEGETFQTLGVYLWPPQTDEEAAQITGAVPNLLGLAGVQIEDVYCYDADNMMGWRELHVTRPETAGPWTPETANGLLNAVQVALSTEVLPPIGDSLSLPAAE